MIMCSKSCIFFLWNHYLQVILVGNKCDMEDERVSSERKMTMIMMFRSCKTHQILIWIWPNDISNNDNYDAELQNAFWYEFGPKISAMTMTLQVISYERGKQQTDEITMKWQWYDNEMTMELQVISYERGKQLADSLGLDFFETSAKENINVRVCIIIIKSVKEK